MGTNAGAGWGGLSSNNCGNDLSPAEARKLLGCVLQQSPKIEAALLGRASSKQTGKLFKLAQTLQILFEKPCITVGLLVKRSVGKEGWGHFPGKPAEKSNQHLFVLLLLPEHLGKTMRAAGP